MVIMEINSTVAQAIVCVTSTSEKTVLFELYSVLFDVVEQFNRQQLKMVLSRALPLPLCR